MYYVGDNLVISIMKEKLICKVFLFLILLFLSFLVCAKVPTCCWDFFNSEDFMRQELSDLFEVAKIEIPFSGSVYDISEHPVVKSWRTHPGGGSRRLARCPDHWTSRSPRPIARRTDRFVRPRRVAAAGGAPRAGAPGRT